MSKFGSKFWVFEFLESLLNFLPLMEYTFCNQSLLIPSEYTKYPFRECKSRHFWWYDMIWYEHDETIIIKYDNCGVQLFHLSTSSISASSPTGFPEIYLFNSIQCNLSDKIRALFSVIAMGILVRDVSLSGVSERCSATVSPLML